MIILISHMKDKVKTLADFDNWIIKYAGNFEQR